MRRIQIICDRCGVEVNGNSYRFKLIMLDEKGEEELDAVEMPRPMPEVAGKLTVLDYCPKCAALLTDIITIAKPQEKTKATKAKPKETEKGQQDEEDPEDKTMYKGIKLPMVKGKPLDIEKLIELRKRRWTVLDISNELGCAMSTINRILRQLEKRGEVPNEI